MLRMRGGITEAVLPVAKPYLCAIAYDPFRGKRLGMLYRILAVHDTSDLGTTLAAARPITTTALLATVLHDAGGPLDAATATAAVTARLRALPANVFVDPELQRDVAGCVIEALAGVRTTDPRFPHIADMIAYQTNMLAETLTCAARLAAPEPAAVTL
jgi:hypothetical protein